MTDEEQQEAEGEQHPVPRDVPSQSDRDKRLHGKEAEKHSPGDADAPSDPADPRADEAPQAPDRDDESCHSERPKQGPEIQVGRFGPEGKVPGLSCEDQCAGENRCEPRARVGTRQHRGWQRRSRLWRMQRGAPGREADRALCSGAFLNTRSCCAALTSLICKASAARRFGTCSHKTPGLACGRSNQMSIRFRATGTRWAFTTSRADAQGHS